MARKISVEEVSWSFKKGQGDRPGIRISNGFAFVVVPVEQARRVVDEVHDAMDAFETRMRQEGKL